jgi:2-oxo-4-hydroxy-4-carboxy-5-ureidoimidazoline decarboxylase
MPYSLAELNAMSQAEFVAALGDVFEETPAIAKIAWYARPFSSAIDLHQQMVNVVNYFSPEKQLALIQAHPDLGSKVRMAEASVKEQAGAGLSQLSQTEYEEFQQLNQAYTEKFGFPFIIAVKNHTKESILTAFQSRLENFAEQERQQALAEIAAIARFRLTELVLERFP